MQSINLETGLPARIADERTQLLQPSSQPKLLGLILANIAALFSVSRLPALVTALPFTRPADTTAYASGDLVANSTTAGSVAPIQLSVARTANGVASVRRVRLKKSGTSVTNSAFRVHLFAGSPTVTNGDNGVFLATHSGYVGAFDVATMQAFSDGAQGHGVPLVGTELTFQTIGGDTKIYALLEARGAYTPASAETFTLTAEALQG